ncbi:MAG: hypothetical protein M3R01_07485 [Actinomycetota bacterium]|nr:hypothetical protein [Actinomycetota bacterium]
MTGRTTTTLRHGKVTLALHQLRPAGDSDGAGRPLLLLHGLGEALAHRPARGGGVAGAGARPSGAGSTETSVTVELTGP